MSSEKVELKVTLMCVTDDSEIPITVFDTDDIISEIRGVLKLSNKYFRLQAKFGENNQIEEGETFEDWDIEDGARICVSYNRRLTVAEVAAEVAALNPPLTVEELMRNVEVDTADPSRVVRHLSWSGRRITVLPESIGSLTVGGSLRLDYNQLVSLPESIGSLTVGGSLDLYDNDLASLPESFGSLKVGGNLDLSTNRLASLPKSFGSLTVGGDLWLCDNRLASLPERFGFLTIGGTLRLERNQLASLPGSFGSLTVGGKLKLDFYLLALWLDSLPENVEGIM